MSLSDPARAGPRQLLFAALALDAGLIQPGQLADACACLAAGEESSLADLLRRRGWLSLADCDHVEALVARRLAPSPEPEPPSTAVEDDFRGVLAVLRDSDVGSIHDRPTNPGLSDDSTVDPLAGRSLGGPPLCTKYERLRVHAQGGIGRVWLARDAGVGREVALKELRPDRLGDAGLAARFLAEARVTGQLEHPGIVPVYELSWAPGEENPSYVMRFIRGRTLSEAVADHHRRRRSGHEDALELLDLLNNFTVVCNAVAYAHARGVVHRDLKGLNILLGDFGEVMVVDWGLAKVIAAADPRPGAAPLPPVSIPAGARPDDTLPGQVVGTVAYMAPEQAVGDLDRIDARTDVYGLGAVLYEILTGAPPFPGDNPVEILERVVRDPPVPPRKVVASVPRALEAVCLKALAKEPRDRYPSASALAEEVRRFVADEPVTAYREPWPVRARRWAARHRTLVSSAAAALVVAAGLLTAGVVLLNEAREDEYQARLQATSSEARAIQERDEARRQRDRADANLALARKAVDDTVTHVAQDARLSEGGFHELRTSLLASAVPFYEEFVKQKADDPEIEVERGLAYGRLAFVRLQMGDYKAALVAGQRGRELLASLGASLKSPARRTNLAAMLDGLGHASFRLGRSEEALAHHREALRITEELAREDPKVLDHRRRAGNAANHVAIALNACGRFDEARRSYEAAMAHLDSLPPQWAVDEKARVRQNLASLLLDFGRTEESLQLYREAAAMAEQLVKASPTPEARNRLVASLSDLIRILHLLGKTEEAGPLCGTGQKIGEQLLGEFPSVGRYRQAVAAMHHVTGIVHSALQDPGKARTAFERATALLEPLVKEQPGVPVFREELSRVLGNHATLIARGGQYEEAMILARRALDLATGLQAEAPTDRKRRFELATAREHLGLLLGTKQDYAGALDHYRAAEQIHEKLAAEFPSLTEYRYHHAMARRHVGVALHGLDRRDEAEQAQREALALLEKLAAEAPTVMSYRIGEARVREGLGYFLTAYWKLDEGLPMLRRAFKDMEALAAAAPGDREHLKHLGASLWRFAKVLEQAKRPEEGREVRRRAAATLERYIAAVPGDLSVRLSLATDLLRLSNAGGEQRDPAELQWMSHDAARLWEKLTTDFPGDPKHRVQWGNACINAAYNTRPPEKALPWFGRAIEVLTPLERIGPPAARLFLHHAHAGRAEALTRLRRHREADADYARALELAEPMEKWQLNGMRILTLIQVGEHDRAAAALADLSRSKDTPAEALPGLAAECMRAGAGAFALRHAQQYAVIAMRTLARAADRGSLRREHLNDPVWAPLRGSSSFQTLLKRVTGN